VKNRARTHTKHFEDHVEGTNNCSHDQKDRISLQEHPLYFIQFGGSSGALLCGGLVESHAQAGVNLEFTPTQRMEIYMKRQGGICDGVGLPVRRKLPKCVGVYYGVIVRFSTGVPVPWDNMNICENGIEQFIVGNRVM
jgi:hypothetical protein